MAVTFGVKAGPAVKPASSSWAAAAVSAIRTPPGSCGETPIWRWSDWPLNEGPRWSAPWRC